MVNNEVDYSTIRIKNDLRKELDSLKIETESYSVVIAKIIDENKRLEETIEYLKEDRKDLYKLALGTENSVALINNYHKATYFIVKVLNDISSNEEKLQQLKEYLSEMLASDKASVIGAIENLIDMLQLEEEPVPDVLVDFENFISGN